MFKKTALILCVLFTGIPANAQPEAGPLEFKGIALGQSSLSVQADSRYGCRPIRATYADELCMLRNADRETIGGARIKTLSVHLYDGVVHRITITFETREFDQVQAAALQKYGSPGSTSIEELRNKAGAIFTSQRLHWNKPNGKIRIDERFGQVDVAHFEISSHEAPAIFNQRTKDAGGKNAKDF